LSNPKKKNGGKIRGVLKGEKMSWRHRKKRGRFGKKKKEDLPFKSVKRTSRGGRILVRGNRFGAGKKSEGNLRGSRGKKRSIGKVGTSNRRPKKAEKKRRMKDLTKRLGGRKGERGERIMKKNHCFRGVGGRKRARRGKCVRKKGTRRGPVSLEKGGSSGCFKKKGYPPKKRGGKKKGGMGKRIGEKNDKMGRAKGRKTKGTKAYPGEKNSGGERIFQGDGRGKKKKCLKEKNTEIGVTGGSQGDRNSGEGPKEGMFKRGTAQEEKARENFWGKEH